MCDKCRAYPTDLEIENTSSAPPDPRDPELFLIKLSCRLPSRGPFIEAADCFQGSRLRLRAGGSPAAPRPYGFASLEHWRGAALSAQQLASLRPCRSDAEPEASKLARYLLEQRIGIVWLGSAPEISATIFGVPMALLRAPCDVTTVAYALTRFSGGDTTKLTDELHGFTLLSAPNSIRAE